MSFDGVILKMQGIIKENMKMKNNINLLNWRSKKLYDQYLQLVYLLFIFISILLW